MRLRLPFCGWVFWCTPWAKIKFRPTVLWLTLGSKTKRQLNYQHKPSYLFIFTRWAEEDTQTCLISLLVVALYPTPLWHNNGLDVMKRKQLGDSNRLLLGSGCSPPLSFILKLRRNPKTAGKENPITKTTPLPFVQQNYFIPEIICSRICWVSAKLVEQVVLRGDFVHANPPPHYTSV